VATYEGLRRDVMQGQSRPEDLGAIVYHGMLEGLAVMLARVEPANNFTAPHEPVVRPVPHDRDFVRVLANMLLRSQSEVMHVY
jgi:hypothetical protein